MTTFHKFHIPVMGLGYTIDTPIKVAKYGISSVVSIVQDDLIEKARRYYSQLRGKDYSPITTKEQEYRSKRITAYLNLVNELVNEDFEALKLNEAELEKYARLLPGNVSAQELKNDLSKLQKGSIDVNIMTKLDRMPEQGSEITEACAALKGYADSELDSALVLSAGLNPRLFAFMEQFSDFYPDAHGYIKKRIVLKVSDYRSAALQGKMLAKKGLFVSEYRVESGLNCGGHTFATDGLLMGPILEEFKNNREVMALDQFNLCAHYWETHQMNSIKEPVQKLTVQGGIGTSDEREMLEKMYHVDSTGWGSPFLLVPEATSIDDETLEALAAADEKDIYNSQLSPLGVSFSVLRTSSAARIREENIMNGKPGSPCYRKHLALDTSYKASGICTASVSYQRKRIKELNDRNLTPEAYDKAYHEITSKECLCDGLAMSFLKKFDLLDDQNTAGVSVCPGPNLAYFDRTYTLEEMVGHIYGKQQVLTRKRPHVFIKEFQLYLDHLEKMISDMAISGDQKQEKKIQSFGANLKNGLLYYAQNVGEIGDVQKAQFINDLLACEERLEGMMIGESAAAF